MFSIRGFWVFKLKEGDILAFRRFPTVEQRLRKLWERIPNEQDDLFYAPLPETDSSLVHELQTQILSASCAFLPPPHNKQVLPVLCGVWPFVWAASEGLVYVVLPSLILPSSGPFKMSILAQPNITLSFSVLEMLIDYMSKYSPTYNQLQLSEFYSLISLAIPFGKPLPLTLNTSKHFIVNGFSSEKLKTIVATWQPQPVTKTSGQKLIVNISETFYCAQYDNKNVPNVCSLRGIITANGDVESGYMASYDISSLTSSKDLLSFAPSSFTTMSASKKSLQFHPPGGTFSNVLIARYEYQPSFVPLRGFYQIVEKGPNTFRLLVQLKLEKQFNNNFTYFDVLIPFFGKGHLSSCQSPGNLGSLGVLPDLCTIVWSLGQKIPSTNLELTLTLQVSFSDSITESPLPVLYQRKPPSLPGFSYTKEKDIFRSKKLVNENQERSFGPETKGISSFIEISFKSTNYLPSSLPISSKDFTLFPNTKLNVTLNKEVYTYKYRIWNSHGNFRYCEPEEKILMCFEEQCE